MGITAFPFSSVIDVPTARILGRDDAGTGSAEALTNTEIFAILGTGTPSASTYLRGDGTWSTVSAGVGGSTGSTDNRILRADGTGGATLQSSLVSINDAGQIQFHGSYGLFNVQIRNPDWGSSHGILLSSVGTAFVTNGGYLWRVEPSAGNFLGVASSQIQFTADCRLQRGDAAGVLRQFSGTQSQKYELYNTYTSDTSYERLNIAWASNVCYIGTEKGSAGGTARDLTLGTDGAVRLVLPAATTSGALYLGPQTDNTATGGNARGANAVDLQTLRSAAANVASGTGSAILGGDGGGRASGSHAVSLGGGVATAQGAVAGGGTREGVRSTASGVASAAFCGGNASSDDCFSVGWASSSTGAYGSISLGNTVRSTGGRGSLATGQESLADRQSQTAHSAGQFSAQGDAQRVEFVLRNKTTTNSAVTLFLNGSSQRLTIPSGKILHATVHILGSKSDGTAVANYMRQVCIKNVGGTTSLVGTVNTIGTDEAAGTSIAITADDTNDALQINVTGVTSETWRWVAVVYGVEIAYGT